MGRKKIPGDIVAPYCLFFLIDVVASRSLLHIISRFSLSRSSADRLLYLIETLSVALSSLLMVPNGFFGTLHHV